MPPRGARLLLLVAVLGGAPLVSTPSFAQDTPPAAAPTTTGAPALSDYFTSLTERRLLSAETINVEALRGLVRRAEELVLDERYDEAALLLYEVTESPGFADYVELEDFRSAEYLLAGATMRLGALRTANRYLDRILARGGSDPYFGPAYRRAVDVALEQGDLDEAVTRLEGVVPTDQLTQDARDELSFLRGRAKYEHREFEPAEASFAEVTRQSRFFASAQYFRGAIAVRQGHLAAAEQHFCTITGTGDREETAFYVDWRYFEVKDLARLGLGRVAHEATRSDDAFYYYFQIPQDSTHLDEAMFEAAYATYEGGDYDTSIDLLDQLDARFPASPYASEATLLRGYIHLSRCDFEDASQLFVRFGEVFTPVLAEADEVLASPSRQAHLYEELLEQDRAEREATARAAQAASTGATAAPAPRPSVRQQLLALLSVDPAFYRLHADVRTLDAEAARAGRLGLDLAAISDRVRGNDAPLAADAAPGEEDEITQLRRQISEARAAVSGLTDQLDALRTGGATREQLQPLQQEVAALGARVNTMERGLREALRASPPEAPPPATEPALEALLRRDRTAANALPQRVARLRAGLVDVANTAALDALRALRDRLAGDLRRARIGRIDAVMGSKRRIEIQIESLAAGRFPAELQDPLRVQGLLRDDEEYWPFQGELWADEYVDNLADEGPEPAFEEDLASPADAAPEADDATPTGDTADAPPPAAR